MSKTEASFEDLLRAAKERVALLTANLPTLVDPASISVEAKIPYKAICFREAILWRTEELAAAAYQHYETRKLAAALTLTRATIEGVAATWYLKDAMHSVVETQAVASFDDTAMKLLFGSKDGSTELSAINVLTFIDKINNQIPGFRRCYEGLCEFAHPNWSGTSGLYSRIDRDRVLTEFGNNLRESEFHWRSGLNGLNGALGSFEYAYNKIGELIDDFVKVCEADLAAKQPRADSG